MHLLAAEERFLELLGEQLDGASLREYEQSPEPYAIPVSMLLTQVLSHASEHRAQVATVLGAHGITPPALDA